MILHTFNMTRLYYSINCSNCLRQMNGHIYLKQKPFKNPFHTINNNKITLKLQQHRTPPTRRNTKDTKAFVAGSDPLATEAAIQSNS